MQGRVTPAVWFTYSPDRKGEHPKRHLQNFKGALQADAYAGFHHLYDTGSITEAACWRTHGASFTRSIWRIRRRRPPKTSSASPRSTPSRRRSAAAPWSCAEKSNRQEPRRCSQACTCGLKNTLAKLSRKLDTAAAIRYALSRCRALTRYIDDGRLAIDNNAAERALRVVALGRKNFLFAGFDAGGERAAALYSLFGSAKLNGLGLEIYL